MKRYALILSILTALVLTPTAAFAKDKNKDYYQRQAQIIADRRANGYYDAPRYPVDNCAPRYYSADQDGRYSRDDDRYYSHHRRGGF